MQLHPHSPPVGLEKLCLQTHRLAIGINKNIDMDLRICESTISNKLLIHYSLYFILVLCREEN